MKVLLLITLAIGPIDDIKKIARVNSLKEEARKAYNNGDFDRAKNAYTLLVDSLEINEDELRLNLANSYFNLKDTENAGGQYQQLSNSENKVIKSAALQQLGVMANREGKFNEALELFKQSIKANPMNDDARFNYEMLKKKLKEQEDQQQEDQQKDDQNQDQQKEKNQEQQDKDKQNQDNKDKQDQEQQDENNKDQQQDKENDQQNKENKDQSDQSDEEKDKQQDEIPPSTADKLKDMKISEDKARMLLEAMKNQEIQYLQQNKRKATQRKDPSKPDW